MKFHPQNPHHTLKNPQPFCQTIWRPSTLFC
ncbi:hypothetical protein FOPG_18496 [Fusarium oxysporum f. sp. conglutinans race 2 54008]|uniref:Uncharacterized protein n=1 Tax=Fusarium oxysporum f. sp. conglutinans race 2 54008 TaxID=1089457 RepID=X0GZG6_FUSOX|nr:hypothetical protein FOPG_18496 [Fusarium oxysporum f. sp. conglutinans race 2 54008]